MNESYKEIDEIDINKLIYIESGGLSGMFRKIHHHKFPFSKRDEYRFYELIDQVNKVTIYVIGGLPVDSRMMGSYVNGIKNMKLLLQKYGVKDSEFSYENLEKHSTFNDKCVIEFLEVISDLEIEEVLDEITKIKLARQAIYNKK